MSETERPTAAFVISLVAGVFVILGGLFSTFMGMWGFGMMGLSFRGMRGMMGQQAFGVVTALGFVGIFSGVAILVSAFMLNSRPSQASLWGTLILVFSIVSLFGGFGGFLVGIILGIIAGALALSWKPNFTPKT